MLRTGGEVRRAACVRTSITDWVVQAAPVVDAKAALDLPSELERQGDGLAGALRMMEVTV